MHMLDYATCSTIQILRAHHAMRELLQYYSYESRAAKAVMQ